MTDDNKESHKESQGNESRRTRKKAAVFVGFLCFAVVASVVAMDSHRVQVHSSISEPVMQPATLVPSAAPVPNAAPVILSVTPATDRIAPFDLCQVVCEAVDDDGDILTYTWVTDEGEVFGEGTTIEWGAPNSQGLYLLSVSVDDGHGGTATCSISLRVKTNHAPQIQSMSSTTSWIAPGETVNISCSAQDADGDEVSYEWSASAGEMHGQGNAIVWVAPGELGSCWVTVSARDAYSGVSKREIPISVASSQPPTLGEFAVKGIKTDMVKPVGGAWKVFRGSPCSIECSVLDGSGPYTFTWTADRGTLTADRSAATWNAPSSGGPATIKVDVTDRRGNTASGLVLISVETCTCSFK